MKYTRHPIAKINAVSRNRKINVTGIRGFFFGFLTKSVCRVIIRTGTFCPLLLVGLVALPVQSQPVQVITARKQVVIGEPFKVSFIATGARKGDVIFPKLSEKGVEILGYQDRDSTDAAGGLVAIREYQLMLLQPGEFTLPSQTIRIWQESISHAVKTAPVAVYAELLPVTQPDLHPGPPVAIIYTRQEWLPYVLGVAGLLALGAGLIVYRQRKSWAGWLQRTAQQPQKTALQQLRILQQTSISGDAQTSTTWLSYILKDYLTHHFGIRAHHLTAGEIVQSLAGKGVDHETASQLKHLFYQLQTAIYNPASRSDFEALLTDTKQLIQTLNQQSSRH